MSAQTGAPLVGLPPDEQAAINLSLGAVVVGNYISFLTMGVVGCYTWTYFSTFPNDRWIFKLLVSTCCVLCLADTAGTGIWVYDWAVAGYANPGVMGLTHWAFPAEAMFLCEPFSSAVPPLLQLAHHDILKRHSWDTSLMSTSGWEALLGADVLITTSMIYYLDLRFRMKETSKVGPGTNSRFREIIYRTVECNVLSLIAQTTTIGLFNSPSVGLYFALPDMTLAKIYTFSLIVSLLGRRSNGSGLSGVRNTSSKSGGEQHALSDRCARNHNSGTPLEVAIKSSPSIIVAPCLRFLTHKIADTTPWKIVGNGTRPIMALTRFKKYDCLVRTF
ncbi:hypothetical protein B0H14DRAFT_3876950 [Mycena olivaceomarginata]|nr:hypothetical protein B0H14DRAFT_3876950 [Mycena olivaceomarginata]